MATRYVNTASTAGGDGTTNGTSGATRAYASLSEWEAARQANLTGAGAEIAICEGSTADATAVTIDGWTTTASDYIEIRVEQANRHPGTWSTSHYRLVLSAAFASALTIIEPYVRLEGLQVQNTYGSSHSLNRGVKFNTAVAPGSDDSRMAACIVRNTVGGANIEGVAGKQTLVNTISYGTTGIGISAQYGSSGNTMVCHNCVAAGNGSNGFFNSSGSNTGTLINCYSGGNTGADYSTNWDTRTTCYSEDGSESTSTAAYSTSSGAYFANITAGSEDFDIGSSSTLKDVGTDLSGNFTTDITGATRSGTWDVGAFEYVSGGTSYDVAIAETGSASDSLSATIAATATVSESASGADSMSAALAAIVAVAESGSAADTLAGGLALTAAIAETGAASDSHAAVLAAVATVSEAAAAVDAVASVLAAAAALSESGAAADTVAAIGSLVAALAESVTATDSVNWGGATYSADIAEAASATNSLSAAVQALATLAVTGGATDTVSSLASLQAAIAEAVSALDTVAAAGVFQVTVTETGAAADTVTALGDLGPAPATRTVTVQMANRTITVEQTGRVIRVQAKNRSVH